MDVGQGAVRGGGQANKVEIVGRGTRFLFEWFGIRLAPFD